MSSNCKTCGEALGKTGNYTVRILPAKRVPKKARKMMKTMANMDDSAEQASSIETSSFERFLRKRIRPVNFMEVSCGKCGGVSKIKMSKSIRQEARQEVPMKKVKESERSLMSPSITLSSRKGKKKARDLNAGLTIVMDASKSGESSSSTSQVNPISGRKRPVSAFQKQKDMANLKKVLFHSKKAKKSGSSLQDFLSGI